MKPKKKVSHSIADTNDNRWFCLKTRQKELLTCRQLQSNTVTTCTNSDEKLKLKATRQGISEMGFLRVGAGSFLWYEQLILKWQ